MALCWDVTKCDKERWAAHPFLKAVLGKFGLTMNPLTDRMVWLCIPLGMGGWKDEKDAEEAAWRAEFYQTLYGPWYGIGGERFNITAADIFAHIGMTVNVSRETRAQFVKRVTKYFGERGTPLKGAPADLLEKAGASFVEEAEKEKAAG